jgi:hypothetical protein
MARGEGFVVELRATLRGSCGHLYVVVTHGRATILPWSGRPTGRSPGWVRRYAARFAELFNDGFFELYNEANDEVNSSRNNCWNDFLNSSRCSTG